MHYSSLLSVPLLAAAVSASPLHHASGFGAQHAHPPTTGRPHPPNSSGTFPVTPMNGSQPFASGRPAFSGTGFARPSSAVMSINSRGHAASSGANVPVASATSVSSSGSAATPTDTLAISTLASAEAVATSSVTVAAAGTPSKILCGTSNADDPRASPSGSPWTYASDNYAYTDMAGGSNSYCVGFYDAAEQDGSWTIHWSSIWNIDKATCPVAEITKGYANVAVAKNLKTQISAVESMQTKWTWTASNTDGIKGCITFDFIMGPTPGDYTSTGASGAKELMLWLWWSGDDKPIDDNNGPVATLSLFGKDGWQLYQGYNKGSQQLVSSLLAPADNMYDGDFEGDLKDWFVALSDKGSYKVYDDSWYVNVGNQGTEAWYGDVTFDFQTTGFEIAVAK